jgi:hypothetical protein
MLSWDGQSAILNELKPLIGYAQQRSASSLHCPTATVDREAGDVGIKSDDHRQGTNILWHTELWRSW